MYEIVVTEDFINVIKAVPLRYLSALLQSFISLKKLENEKVECEIDNTFLADLLEQIESQEVK